MMEQRVVGYTPRNHSPVAKHHVPGPWSEFRLATAGLSSTSAPTVGTMNAAGSQIRLPLFFNGSPAVAKGRVYIGLEDGVNVYAAAGCGQSQCSPLFTLFGSGEQAAVISSPTVANGVVYAGRNTSEVLAWPAAGCGSFVCTEIWSGDTGDPIVTSSPTVVNGTLYIGSANDLAPENTQGRIYVFDLP